MSDKFDILVKAEGKEPDVMEWRAYLKQFKAGDLVKPGFQLISVPNQTPVLEALRLMLRHHISSVAVTSNEGSIVGFLDVLDISALIYLFSTAKDFADLLSKDPVSWNQFNEEEMKMLQEAKVENLVNLSERDEFADVRLHTPLTEVIGLLGTAHLKNLDNVRKDLKVRRVVVRDNSEKVVGIISHYDMLKFMQRVLVRDDWFVLTNFLDILPAKYADQGTANVITILDSKTAMSGYALMNETGVSAVAVVGPKGNLVGVLSASDFLGSARGGEADWGRFFSDLQLPISEYLLSRNAYFRGDHSKKPITIVRDDTPVDVCAKMIGAHIHRLFRVDAASRPIAVFSIGDVLTVMSQYDGITRYHKLDPKKKKKKKKNKNKK